MKLKQFFILIILSGFLSISFADNFKLLAYKKVTLDNGLTLYLMEQHEVPLIYISALIPSGSAFDGNKNGLAFLTSESLLFGTKSYLKKQIEESFEFYGADISTTTTSEFIKVNASFAKQDQDRLLPIFQEIILSPTFPDDEVEKRKQRLLVELDQAKESPRQVIRSYFNKFIFAENELGNPVQGTKSKISEITADDIKNFYTAFFNPSNSSIAVVGDFNTDEMQNKIRKLFQSWNATSTSSLKTIPTVELNFNSSRVLLINKDDARETTILIGGKGINRANPEYTEVQVVNTILGDRFTSWLNEELRINSGLTYGVRSTFIPYKNTGTFFISTFTATANTERVIDLALEVLDRLHTKGITNEVLNSSKSYLNGQFSPNFETSGSLVNLLNNMYYYGFDESYINNFENQVDELTVKKTNEIIEKYFPKDNLQFVIIGKATDIKDIIKKYGELTEKEIISDGF